MVSIIKGTVKYTQSQQFLGQNVAMLVVLLCVVIFNG